MPKLCTYANCRKRVSVFTNQFCTEHKTEAALCKPAMPICEHERKSHYYKGLCKSCYCANYPDDPLTFQLKYRNRFDAIHAFINHHFDGFQILCSGLIKYIIIENTAVCVDISSGLSIPDLFDPDKRPNKFYIIQFSFADKHQMLFTRLLKLQNTIHHLFECILNNENKDENNIKYFSV